MAIKSHTSNSFIIEIKAVGTAAMPGWKTLRTLADMCKAAAVAASCRNLDQLCAAALRQAARQMRIPGLARPQQPPAALLIVSALCTECMTTQAESPRAPIPPAEAAL